MAARIQARTAGARSVGAAARPVFRAASATVVARAAIKGGGKGGEEGAKDYGKTLFGQLVKNGDCMLFGTGISKAELKDTLMIDGEGCKEYTIFAPTDDAFGDYCKKNGVTKLELMNLPQIPDVIKGHVVEGKYPMDQIPEEMTTLAGTTIKAPKVVMNKGRSKKKLANFNSTNGCYHMIDEVLA